MPEDKELIRARNYAFRLLKIRTRSEKELEFRLKQKNFSPEIINELMASLSAAGYLNDLNFAHSWVRERINRPLGLRRLEFELRQKGIDKEIIESVLTQAKKDYPEREIAANLVKDKFKKIITKEIDYKTKGRIQGYLLRRGFSPEIIMDVLEKL